METPTSIELFAIPFTCSLASHLALEERGLTYTIHWMDRGPNKRFGDDEPFDAISPSGKVPAVRLGPSVLCENGPVLLRIATLAEPSRPTDFKELEWLSYIGTELHKQVLAVAYDPDAPESCKSDAVTRLLPPVLRRLDSALATTDWLGGTDGPGLPDAYLFWALLLVAQLKVDLQPYPALLRLKAATLERPATQKVLARERAQYAMQKKMA